MRLYSRKEKQDKWFRWLDATAIYSATIYPLLYWHIHATDSLAWFIKGDFITLNLKSYDPVFQFFYVTIALAYVAKELYMGVRTGLFNIPKNLIIAGTYVSWYVGIVAFQGDLIFTLLNVVAHGIPYIALIWIHGEKKTKSHFRFNVKGLSIFLVTILLLAYIEEFLWDVLVWKDHPELFPAVFTFLTSGQSLDIVSNCIDARSSSSHSLCA